MDLLPASFFSFSISQSPFVLGTVKKGPIEGILNWCEGHAVQLDTFHADDAHMRINLMNYAVTNILISHLDSAGLRPQIRDCLFIWISMSLTMIVHLCHYNFSWKAGRPVSECSQIKTRT